MSSGNNNSNSDSSVKWLGSPQDESERWLREGLDLAARRTDELALRRIWARVSEMDPWRDQPPLRRWAARLGFLLAGMAVATGVAASVAFVWPAFRADALPVPMADGRGLGSLPLPAPPPALNEAEPVLLGPTMVRTGPREARTVRLKGGARVALDAHTTLAVDAGQRPALHRGRVKLQVPRQAPGETFTVAVGPYVIVVVGTTFDVGMNSGRVAVDVDEGVVEVWRDGQMVRLQAGHSWRGPVRETPRARRTVAMAPPPAVPLPPHPADRFLEAKTALAAGDTATALQILEHLSAGTGPTAENSSYEIGRVLRDHRRQPRAALAAWRRYSQRFPGGLLRAEADVSTIETLLVLGDRTAALAEAEAFLQRHPGSERRTEMAQLVSRLRRTGALENSRVGQAGQASNRAPANQGFAAPSER